MQHTYDVRAPVTAFRVASPSFRTSSPNSFTWRMFISSCVAVKHRASSVLSVRSARLHRASAHSLTSDCSSSEIRPQASTYAEVQDPADDNVVFDVRKECVPRRLCEPRGDSVMLDTAVAPFSDSGVPGDDGIPASWQQATTATIPTLASRRRSRTYGCSVGGTELRPFLGSLKAY